MVTSFSIAVRGASGAALIILAKAVALRMAPSVKSYDETRLMCFSYPDKAFQMLRGFAYTVFWKYDGDVTRSGT